MIRLVGYSTPGEGYCVHDDSGITWGDHPGSYRGPLVFLRDDATGMVTAVGREATQAQRETLQKEPTAWSGGIPHEEAVVTASHAMAGIVMLHEGP